MSSEPSKQVFVVVPAYNEGAVLPRTVADLLERKYNVVVVDDGSTDNTAEIAGFPVYYVRHAVNLGQGAALQTGMTKALQEGAEILVHFDADGQHNPDQIPCLIEPILEGRADVVLGSRFLNGADASAVPPAKRLALRIGTVVSAIFSGIWLTDTHNGFRALSRRAAQSIRLRENGFAHATELLVSVHDAGLSYIEVPVTVRYTPYSMAKGQSVWNGISIVFDLLLAKLFR